MSVIDVGSGPPLAVWSDCELVGAVRAGDDDAYEELYRRHHRRVVGYVRAILGDRGGAEDVTQEAFISGLRGLRVTRAEVAFKPWIFAIARNACIDLLRRARVEQLQIDGNGGNGTALVELPAEPPDAELARRERLDCLVAALDELPNRHRSVLIMRELEGLSSREIAKRAGLTRPAVESTLFRARRELRETYDALEAGTRCGEMTALIARLAEGFASRRELRRVESHAQRCAHCRRRARGLGVELGNGAGRLAGLLPLPWLLRDSGRQLSDDSPWQAVLSGMDRGRTWVLAGFQGSDAAGAALVKVVATVAAAALIGGVVGREVLDPRGAFACVALRGRARRRHVGRRFHRRPGRIRPRAGSAQAGRRYGAGGDRWARRRPGRPEGGRARSRRESPRESNREPNRGQPRPHLADLGSRRRGAHGAPPPADGGATGGRAARRPANLGRGATHVRARSSGLEAGGS